MMEHVKQSGRVGPLNEGGDDLGSAWKESANQPFGPAELKGDIAVLSGDESHGRSPEAWSTSSRLSAPDRDLHRIYNAVHPMPHWATNFRLRRCSGPPAPVGWLRHPYRLRRPGSRSRYDQPSTNIYPGPPNGGRS